MRKHRPDFAIVAIVLALMAVGLITIYVIGPRVAQATNTQYGTSFSDSYYVIHHLIAIAMSVVAIIAGYFIKIDKISKYAKWMIRISLATCLLVVFFGAILHIDALVTCDKGACRSLRIPIIGLGFMPTELLKVAMLFYISWLIKDRKEKGELDSLRFWLPLGVLSAAILVLVTIGESDFGSTVVMFTMILAMMWVGGVDVKRIAMLVVAGVLIAAVAIFATPYRRERVANSDSYHQDSSLVSIGTGGIMGVGLGNSIQATGYLPEAISDSIFSILCETMGFVGATAILLGFTILMWKMIGVTQRTQNAEQRIFTIGVFAWIAAHVIINIGGMTAIIPMKGITLPFLSYGGTSMVFIAYAIGAVLQISGWTTREKVKEDENTSSRRGERWTRYAGSRGRS